MRNKPPMVDHSLVHVAGSSEGRLPPSLQAQAEGNRPEPVALLGEAAADNASARASTQDPVNGSGLSAGPGAQLKRWVSALGARRAFTHGGSFDLHTGGGQVGLRLGSTATR